MPYIVLTADQARVLEESTLEVEVHDEQGRLLARITPPSEAEIIERINDADAFSFNSDGGVITIDAVPAAPSAADLKLSVYASDGTLLATADAATNDQHLTIGLPVGSYTAILTSHGNYDDQGQYTITARNLPAGWAPKASCCAARLAALS